MSLGATPRAALLAPRSEAELDELLSRPTAGVVDTLRECPGDVMILGAGGKMGPTLARMVRRALDDAGDGRRVMAVSRFSSPRAVSELEKRGVEAFRSDLSDREAVAALPDAPNVIFMAGQKFGTRELPALTWVTNVVVPAVAAERYRDSRVVAFSTGNVYPLSPASGRGSRETDTLSPIGEYAWSCLGRERVLEHASRARGTRISVVRLNYAVDLRYGVLTDLALKIAAGEPVDARMGAVNVIWQGDASAQAIQSLRHAAVPPFVLNVTGPERLSVRAVALELGRLLDREPTIIGTEEPDALLSDTALAQSLFGPPTVSAETLIAWTAAWVRGGGITLGKSTRFEEREGNF
jgi:nucleoside-diphosphate-sugar epimerase